MVGFIYACYVILLVLLYTLATGRLGKTYLGTIVRGIRGSGSMRSAAIGDTHHAYLVP
jgi:hypothetical protein